MMDTLGSALEPGQRVAPFYIACDVSRSMWDKEIAGTKESEPTPFEKLSTVVPGLFLSLRKNPDISSLAWLSVLTFSDSGKRLVPLTRVKDLRSCPALPRGLNTDFRAAFTKLTSSISADLQRLDKGGANRVEPALFFITDGDPQVDGRPQTLQQWTAVRQRMLDMAPKISIVAIGFGNARENTLCRVATKLGGAGPMLAYIADRTMSPVDLLDEISKAIVDSVSASTTRDKFVFKIPPGLRELMC